ncbi:autophagy protein apg5 domain-containing protein [Ditylenchus destructor]|uniref:Autophagy protein 5 n=1 Tax=Ditylenchus destructor TaxID=166010 RepID=A0AAD4NFC8_9BILA|nr:autophagy protein apg5 domain-containing protein [Ditylenchus destructor]
MTSLDDYEIKRTTWESRIPVEFILEESNALMLRKRDHSSFVMLPRISYFSLHLTKVLSRILSSAHANIDDIGGEGNMFEDVWLQSSGEALKWHYPIGVLYDTFANLSDHTSLPWQVTIRLKNFPNELIRCRSREIMRNCFMQSVKEADQLKHKGNIIQSMTAEEHLTLFDAVANERFDDFWAVNKKLMGNGQQNLLHIPIRFYESPFPFRQALVTPRKRKLQSDSAPSEPSTEQKTEGSTPQVEEEEDTLLKDALIKALCTTTDDSAEHLCNEYTAISHGIVLPLDTPVLWMAKNLAYPDNFVHVVLKRRK